VPLSRSIGSCFVTYTQSAAGVTTLTATYNPTDGVHATSSGMTILAVYDANAGFVTGGGWIISPEAACSYSAVCAAAVGSKANFGFVSKYQRRDGADRPDRVPVQRRQL